MLEQWTNTKTGNALELTFSGDRLVSTVEDLGSRYSQVIFGIAGGYMGVVSFRRTEQATPLLVLETGVFRYYNDCQKALEELHEGRKSPSWTADLKIGVELFNRSAAMGVHHV